MSLLSSHEASRKKQLGQYFTGQRVGRLLAALADASSANSILDPMVGSADLLVSCLAIGASPRRLVGLELDPLALARARTALEGVACAELILSDAFVAKLPAEQFDLVITNPPYIRYQSKGDVAGVEIPSGDAVRRGLVHSIKSREALSDDARALWLHAAQSYPGTADIAVPAWILSASLVREGGVLAVVAPQAWLSRNYAHSVRELLDAAFDVEIIVEDGDASWFDEAQVRTHLVVARRRPLGARTSAQSVVMARATRKLGSTGSLRGSLRSEQAVAAALRSTKSAQAVTVTLGLTAHVEHDLSVAARGEAGHVPARVTTALGVEPGVIATRTLESYGWRAGQGLRTGANDFFYLTDDDGLVRPARRWALPSLAIPSDCLLPAVRRQRDLNDELDITASTPLTARLLNLRGWATAADAKRMTALGGAHVLPPDVANWIAIVSKTPFSSAGGAKLFPQLAAVAPNARTDKAGRSLAFWYQLPELAPRHRPVLFMPRVCGGQPIAYANSARAVIDANFSSLWPCEPDALPADALMALLNSSWAWANLEVTCTVLGGGALKVEATDLRRLPLPDLSAAGIDRLNALGRQLRSHRSEEVRLLIDEAVGGMITHHLAAAVQVAGIRELAERSLRYRSRR